MIQDLFEKCAWLLKIIIRGGLEEEMLVIQKDILDILKVG